MAQSSFNPAAYKPVRAPRGDAISCKGWQQEAVLRMLLNSLDPDVAERPEELTICGAFGKAAADWEGFRAIAESLRDLEADQSLNIQNGKNLSVSVRDERSPLILALDSSDVRLGNWLYAGTQTALPVLYEIYAAAARQHFSGTLAGKLVLGAGMGGVGGAQALAATLNGVAFLGVEADPERIKRRVKAGYCDVMVNNLDEALRILKNAVRKKEAASVALIGNCAEILPALAERGVVPDLITDFTPRDPAGNYIPAEFDSASAANVRHSEAEQFEQRRSESLARQSEALAALQRLGSRLISPPEYVDPLLDSGLFLTIWIALSGEPADIAAVDRLALEQFPQNERLKRWLPLARHVRFQGLPARVTWLSAHESVQLAVAANDLVSRSEISAPVLFGWHFSPPLSNPATLESRKSRPALASSFLRTGTAWAYSRNFGAHAEPRPIAAAIAADGTAQAHSALSFLKQEANAISP